MSYGVAAGAPSGSVSGLPVTAIAGIDSGCAKENVIGPGPAAVHVVSGRAIVAS